MNRKDKIICLLTALKPVLIALVVGKVFFIVNHKVISFVSTDSLIWWKYTLFTFANLIIAYILIGIVLRVILCMIVTFRMVYDAILDRYQLAWNKRKKKLKNGQVERLRQIPPAFISKKKKLKNGQGKQLLQASVDVNIVKEIKEFSKFYRRGS